MKAFALERYRDLILAADPGFTRLLRALRAMLTAALTALILSKAAGWVGEPSTLALIGVFVAMMGTVLITDPEPREQQRTMMLLPVVASAVVVLGALIAPFTWPSIVVFCGVIFGAVVVRRFGPRGTALGTIAFLSYFIALFFRAAMAQIPWIIAGIVLATAIAFVVKFWIVRDQRQEVLKSTLRAFRADVEIMLEDLASVMRTPGRMRRHRRRIRKRVEMLNEIALTLESEVGAFRGPDASAAPTALAEAIFEVELAAETLADVFLQLAGSGISADARQRLGAMAQALHEFVRTGAMRARAEAERQLAAVRECRTAPTELACWRMRRAIRALCEHRPFELPVSSTAFPQPAPPVGAAATGAPAGVGRSDGRLSSNLRLAIQATVAGAIAIVVGRLVSPARWYWAAIAAFFVFVRATTLGETIAAAWQRVLGTIFGVAVGLGIAYLVGRDVRVALILVFVGIFAMFYFMQHSYTLSVMFITLVLALLYRVLGRYQPDLLYLRLEETAVGAISGAVVAALVFPSRSSVKIRALMASALRTASMPIAEATAHARPPEDEWRLLASVRDLDRAWQDLWQAAVPLISINFPVSHPLVKQQVRDVSVLAYDVRNLVPLPWGRVPDGVARLIDEIGERLVHNLAAVADALEGSRQQSVRSASDLIDRLRTEGARSMNGETAQIAGWLDRIDRVVMHLARSAGSA